MYKRKLLGFELGPPARVQIRRDFVCTLPLHEIWPCLLFTFSEKVYNFSEHQSAAAVPLGSRPWAAAYVNGRGESEERGRAVWDMTDESDGMVDVSTD